MVNQSVNWDYRWGQIVGRAWADSDFHQRLRNDPVGVLMEYELTPPEGVPIEVHEVSEGTAAVDSGKVLRLMVPARPSAEELCEEELASVVSPMARCGCGGCHGCGGCGGCGGCFYCVWCWYQAPQDDEN